MSNLPPSEFTPRNHEQNESPEQALLRLTPGVDQLIEGYRQKFPTGNSGPMGPYNSRIYPDGGFNEEISGLTDYSSNPYWLKRTVDAQGFATYRLATAFGGPRNETHRSWDLSSPTIHELTDEGEQIDRPVSREDIRDLTAALDILDVSKKHEPLPRYLQKPPVPQMSRKEEKRLAKEFKREFGSPSMGRKALQAFGIKKK